MRVNNLSKSFGKKEVLKKVNFVVNEKEILGIIGKSGSGKSVLIKCLIGFQKPTSGNIKIKNNAKIGFSMQNNSLYEYLTVKQNLYYFSKLYKVGKISRKETINSLITNLELDDFKNALVKNISGGTKKRVDIACALINNPQIIILDEPFTGLDPELVNNLAKVILQLKKQGRTIIISSHRINELSKICNKKIKITKT